MRKNEPDMKRTLTLSIAALTFVALTGCGGSTDSDSNGTPSPFAGNWTGTWNSVSLGQNGTATVNISENGDVAGTTNNTTLGITGTLDGTISEDGTVTGTVQYPGSSATNANGTWSINGAGHIVGNLNQTVGGTSHPISFDMTRN